MRYGKKLALLAQAASSKSDQQLRFISHRELKSYLAHYSKLQKDSESCKTESMYECTKAFGVLLFDDFNAIHNQIQSDAIRLQLEATQLKDACIRMGLMGDAVATQLILSISKIFQSSDSTQIQSLVGEQLRTTWLSMAVQVAKLGDTYNALAERLQSVLSYADINVAGFRKLIKQYAKQVSGYDSGDVVYALDYKALVCDLEVTHSEMDTMRCAIQVAMIALSPQSPSLVEARIGSESLLALSAQPAIRLTTSIDNTIASSISSGLDIGSLQDDCDYLRALGNSVADSIHAQSILFRS